MKRRYLSIIALALVFGFAVIFSSCKSEDEAKADAEAAVEEMFEGLEDAVEEMDEALDEAVEEADSTIEEAVEEAEGTVEEAVEENTEG